MRPADPWVKFDQSLKIRGTSGCWSRGVGRHGPLQVQPEGHHVQPVRGQRPRRACSASAPWADFDAATVRGILGELERLACRGHGGELRRGRPRSAAPGRRRRPPPRRPEAVAGRASTTAAGTSCRSPPIWVGMGAPSQVRWAGQEMMVGANPAAFFYITGALMAVVIGRLGTPDQVEKWAKPMLQRRWGGTMVLTEPDAGSDVGAGTTRAIAVDEAAGVYHLEGVKRFITSGRQRLSREHRPPRPGPPGGWGAGHQGPVDVHRPRLPRRRRRHARGAQRHRRHPCRGQDGHPVVRPPASSPSAPTAPVSGTWSAAATTAFARCSTSSRTPAC